MASPVALPAGVRYVEPSKEFGPRWYMSDIVTPIGILDFHHLYHPDVKGRTPFSRDEYDARLLWPKPDPKFANLQNAFRTIRGLAFADMLDAAGNPKPGWKCRSPIKDGDAPPRQARAGMPQPKPLPDYYKGHWFMTNRSPGARAATATRQASNGRPPRMVDRNKKDVPESEGAALFYRGARVRFMLTASNYTMRADDPSEPDKDGISFKLDVVQFVGHGTPLGGANVNALDELPGEDDEHMGDGPDPLEAAAAGQPARNAYEVAQRTRTEQVHDPMA